MSLDTFDQLAKNTGHDAGNQANTTLASHNDVASERTFMDACEGSGSRNPASKKLIIGLIAAALVGGAGYFASTKLESTSKAIKSDPVATSAPQQTGNQSSTTPNNVGVAAIPGSTPESTSAAAAVSTETMKWEATALKRKIEADLVNTAWPEDKKDCRFLERSDVKGMEILQAVCRQAGAQLYFKCSPSGLRWDPTIPGCEVK